MSDDHSQDEIDPRMIAGGIRGGERSRSDADEAYATVWPIIREMREAGNSFANIAAELNHRGFSSRRGHKWIRLKVRAVWLRFSKRENS